MRPDTALLIVIICLSLLTMQMSGLHLHAGADNESAALHGTHVHDADPGRHGHSHDAETDVSPFEQGTGWFKLIPFLVTLIFALLTLIRTSKMVWPPRVERLSTCHRSRWRPPLRAPPRLSL